MTRSDRQAKGTYLQAPRLTWLALFFGVVLGPAIAELRYTKWMSSHPPIAIAAFVAYEAVVLLIGFLAKVYGQLEAIWVQRATKIIDAWMIRIFYQYRRRYRRHIAEIHRNVDVGGLTIRAPFNLALEQVFVDLTLAQRPPHRLSANPIRTEESRLLPSDLSLEYIQRSSVWEFMQNQDRVIFAIIGAPGSGKTTLLKHITLALAKSPRHIHGSHLHRRMIPVLLYLREHDSEICKNSDAKLADLVTRSSARTLGPDAAKWVERQMRAGRCLVMLDGLDEVAERSARATTVQWVEKQITDYQNASFIITSRPHGYQENPLSTATVLQVRALSPKQVDQFVNLWSVAAEIRKGGRDNIVIRQRAAVNATALLKRIEHTPSLRDLAANPLLLTMMAHLHNYGGTLPQNRVQLYHDICQVFLGKRREAKGLTSGTLTIEQKQVTLRTLAIHFMQNGITEISRPLAEEIVRPTLKNIDPALSAFEFLMHVQNDCGLIVEQETDVIAFVHKTIQEYLTSEQVREKGALKLLTDHLSDSWWRETILLYSAQVDAGTLISACLKDKTPRALALAADCVNIARELAPKWRVAVEGAMSDSAGLDEETRHVIGSALLTRKLRNVIRLSTDTYAIEKPISSAEYRLAADSTAVDTAYIKRRTSLLDVSDSQMVKGVLGGDAIKFGIWVTNLMADGWSYRLPNAAEADDPLIAEVIDTDKYAFWRMDSTSSEGFSPTPILVGAVTRGELQGSMLMASIASALNWKYIAGILATLTPDALQRLSANWASDLSLRVLPTREPVSNWPVIGTLADLLEIVSMMNSFGAAQLSQIRMSILASGALDLDEFENIMDLVVRVTRNPRVEFRLGRNPAEADGAGSLASFVNHQFQMDTQRYLRTLLSRADNHDYERALSRLLMNQQVKSPNLVDGICSHMRVSVDLELTLGLARRCSRLIDDKAFWRIFPAHREVRERSMFVFCATWVTETLDALANGSINNASFGERLAKARICAMLCWYCIDAWQLNHGRASHSPRRLGIRAELRRLDARAEARILDARAEARRLDVRVETALDAYCQILSDLHVIEWRFRGFLPTVEALVLVRS